MHTSTDSYWNSLESVNKDSSILVVPADSMKNAVISDSIWSAGGAAAGGGAAQLPDWT